MEKTVIQHIEESKQTLFSFELLPPLKGHDFESTQQAIDPLLEFNPSFINITYHQQEVVYEDAGNGLMRKQTIRKRPGTVGISAAIKYRYGINVVPHIICGGFSKEDTENALIDLQFLGVNNLLVVRGDPQPGTKVFMPEPDGNEHAIDLIEQIVNLNNGKYLDEKLKNTRSMDFCIGVAGYPEKHGESPNMDSDLYFLKKKIQAGASYIVTQMCYDNQKYFNFVKLCREKGINVPIIPGLKPIAIKENLINIPKSFSVDLPVDLVKEVLKCKNNKEIRQVGVEWAIQQSKELLDFGVPVLHYYTFGQSDNIQKIAKAVF
ncbi:MAG TPA: methylenetetrahydrofolate reductase [Bacteroidales bacterium]|jgi:methylenetetrahydrofolate reductase (NADPH)|nr:methylenetetrahydrofolate reductase [NAD(P)H] [Bacteroidota bacterium]HJN06450.1 methylenetetrahydrofolate reductase [Bacteroidales bacterium]|tara:strand:- start:864 stop:1823 length:960 start_codon:yes stop_codon:yes gene_type:complete